MDEEVTLPDADQGEDVSEVETTEIVDTEESTASDETTEEAPAEQPKKPPKGVQKRLDEITRQRYEAERRAEQERQERIYWQKKAMGEDKPAAPVNKPAVDQFGTYEDYLEALSDWKVDQRLSVERVEREKATQEELNRNRAMTYQERAEKAQAKYDDYAEVAHGNHWSPTKDMADAILESEMGPDIAYYLGSNPEEADRIGRLSPSAQNRELGKLEAKLSSQAATPKRTTTAPPPIVPAGAKAQVAKDPAEMSPAEFAKWRQKYIAQRR